MLAFWRSRPRETAVDRLHAAVVAASRRPDLYAPGGFPDTTEGRFEALTLHVILVLRRLRALPPPAEDVAQDLVDAVFAHLEVALREMGVGDFGVPKRMKKLARAFYDRAATYEPLLDSDGGALAGEIEGRLGLSPGEASLAAAAILAGERDFAQLDLPAILSGLPFAALNPEGGEFASAEAAR